MTWLIWMLSNHPKTWFPMRHISTLPQKAKPMWIFNPLSPFLIFFFSTSHSFEVVAFYWRQLDQNGWSQLWNGRKGGRGRDPRVPAWSEHLHRTLQHSWNLVPIFGLFELMPICIDSKVSKNHWLQLIWLGLTNDLSKPWSQLQEPKNLHKTSATGPILDSVQET